MSSASVRFGTKVYVCARYFLRPGKCFKYIDQRGEDVTEHVYEVMALYPYCVLLRDTRNGVRTCPGYNTLSLMLRGSKRMSKDKTIWNIYAESDYTYMYKSFMDFGKTVFNTKEEAEKKLQELRN